MPDQVSLVKDLSTALAERAPRVELYVEYYRGLHRIRYATEKWHDTFEGLFEELADNWSQIVIDASVERLKIDGFRFGPQDDDADQEAWAIWQANNLDAESIIAHTQACMTGLAYLLVTPTDDPETPRITVESPLQVITFNDPRDRRDRVAGWKQWLDGDTWHAVLYLPDEFQFFARAKNRQTWLVESEPVPNPIGEVPVVPMVNNPDVLGNGMSDLTVMMSLQDAINKLLSDMLVGSEYNAFPQRWATGLRIPDDPQTGRPYDPNVYADKFLSSVSRLWASTNPETQFGSLANDDGGGYVRQIEMLVQHIAAQTRTPPHYLTAGLGQWPSGDSLVASEAGLVAKVLRKQITFGEAWEETMRLAFAFRGDDARANAADIETIWQDPQRYAPSQLADALVKMAGLGVPLDAVFERWGVSPQELARWKAAGEYPPEPPPAQPPAIPAVPQTTDGGSPQ